MKTDSYIPDLLSFLDSSPTASWAVSYLASKLDENGFTRLEEGNSWNIGANVGFYTVRSASSIIAGITGTEACDTAGCRIIGAHTDSPGFRIKPEPDRNKENINVLGVELYGSPILATWFDRDLSLAGTLAVREDDTVFRRSFMIRKPIFRMASPAKHINREVNKNGFKVNSEMNTPLLFSSSGAVFDDVLSLACESADVKRDSVSGWSMEIWDPQPATLGGIEDDFIFSGRLDNLAMCHTAIEALLASEECPETRLVSLFNSEEVGSTTLNGAGSTFLDTVIERLAGGRDEYFRCLSRSIQVSADGAHALHPNYSEKHDPGCHPVLNGGPVIKVNAMEKYTSSDVTSAYFRTCAEKSGVDIQYFVNRNDMPCGITIGPVTSSRLGIRSVDVGNPMLSMHSVRETAGKSDHEAMIRVLAEHMRGSVSIRD
ncbi:MAG: M18 family aminopeptidase [Candidatus Aegiribacteria sp.]|nr:M18 family aminopeptidase [Candidatus Aegiribacteria sp.]